MRAPAFAWPASRTLLIARALIGLVLFFNVQCALAFIFSPGAFAPGFEVGGVPGEAMVRGLGVLFLMWNVPYAVALADPRRHRTSLYEAIAMQAIGLAGESLLVAGLPVGHPALQATAARFIAFDASGLAGLILAALLAHTNLNNDKGQ